jgi:two-component system invasion response regulator UvrY
MMVTKMAVIIADDEEAVRSALRLLLENRLHLCAVSEARDWPGLLAQVQIYQPCLLLLDWELPGLPAATWREELRLLDPGLKILALSGRPEAELQAMATGAQAFTSKTDPPEKLVEAIRGVMSTSGAA